MIRRLIIGRHDLQARMLSAKNAGEEVVLRREFSCEVKSAEDDVRALDFTISTDSVDRYGDTIKVDGWKLESFRKNPVVLWMHKNGQLPVARAINVRVENGKLKARAQFTPAGLEPFNDTVLEMLKGGFLSATSVGFLPLVWNFVNDPSRQFGIDFIEQELLEFSIVTVPANGDALIEGRTVEPLVPPPPDLTELANDRERIKLLRLRAA